MSTLGWQTQRTGFSDEEEEFLENKFGSPEFVPNRKKDRETETHTKPAKGVKHVERRRK